MPCYQRKGYGRFLIQFSYELSKKEAKVLTPPQLEALHPCHQVIDTCYSLEVQRSHYLILVCLVIEAIGLGVSQQDLIETCPLCLSVAVLLDLIREHIDEELSVMDIRDVSAVLLQHALTA